MPTKGPLLPTLYTLAQLVAAIDEAHDELPRDEWGDRREEGVSLVRRRPRRPIDVLVELSSNRRAEDAFRRYAAAVALAGAIEQAEEDEIALAAVSADGKPELQARIADSVVVEAQALLAARAKREQEFPTSKRIWTLDELLDYDNQFGEREGESHRAHHRALEREQETPPFERWLEDNPYRSLFIRLSSGPQVDGAAYQTRGQNPKPLIPGDIDLDEIRFGSIEDGLPREEWAGRERLAAALIYLTGGPDRLKTAGTHLWLFSAPNRIAGFDLSGRPLYAEARPLAVLMRPLLEEAQATVAAAEARDAGAGARVRFDDWRP